MDPFYYHTETAAGLTLVIVYLVVFLFILALCLAVYLFTAIPLFKLAQKHGHARPWYAFIPYASTWLLADLGGQKPLFLLGDNVVFKDRLVSVVVGAIACFLFTPIWALFYYAYLRDLLYLYEADPKKARDTALLISLLDLFLTGGLARAIYLILLLKKTPVAVAVDNPPIPDKAFTF